MVRDTPPKPPIKERDSETLTEDLCIALRQVGVRDFDLPKNKETLAFVQQVQAIHKEIIRRSLDVSLEVHKLSQETGWQIGDLLRDCIAFPEVVPYVREKDGIRRRFRCGVCRQREYSEDDAKFLACSDCLERMLEVVRTRTPSLGFFLFRTYTPEARCAHANENTVLISWDMWVEGFVPAGFCDRCIADELQRRTAKS